MELLGDEGALSISTIWSLAGACDTQAPGSLWHSSDTSGEDKAMPSSAGWDARAAGKCIVEELDSKASDEAGSMCQGEGTKQPCTSSSNSS